MQLIQLRQINQNIIYYQSNNPQTLKPCSSVTDLGIIVQSNLKPGLHCTHITTKVNTRAKLL